MTCTCGGIAPGFPMHEDHCGKPETDDCTEAWASGGDVWDGFMARVVGSTPWDRSPELRDAS